MNQVANAERFRGKRSREEVRDGAAEVGRRARSEDVARACEERAAATRRSIGWRKGGSIEAERMITGDYDFRNSPQ
jgi:hypothetical protein